MKKLLSRLFIFITPLLLLLTIPTCILWKSKENFYTIDQLITGNQKYLIGYSYNEHNYHYLKWACLDKKEKKTIWALGTSRVLEFRAKMFDSGFYNAGNTISGINDFVPFMKNIPVNKYPSYLLIGLDQWMFNTSFNSSSPARPVSFWENSFTCFPGLPATYQWMYADLFRGKYHRPALEQQDSLFKVGLNAVINHKGFRNDGSIDYGNQVTKLLHNDPTADDYLFSENLGRIGRNSRYFGNDVDEKSLGTLNEILAFCSMHHIKVIAFLPPFADIVYSKMIQSGKYNNMKLIYNSVRPLFEQYGDEIYDFSHNALCGSDDAESIDGYHGSELTYQRLLIAMLEAGSALNRVTDVKRLKHDLSHPINRYCIYGN